MAGRDPGQDGRWRHGLKPGPAVAAREVDMAAHGGKNPGNAKSLVSRRCSYGPGPTRNPCMNVGAIGDRKSTRLNSSHLVISYAVFCLKKKEDREHNLAINDFEHSASRCANHKSHKYLQPYRGCCVLQAARCLLTRTEWRAHPEHMHVQ